MEAFGEAFVIQKMRTNPRIRTALFKGLGRKLKQLWALFKRAPQAWEQIKEFLGIESVKEVPKKIKEWGKKGWALLKKGFKALLEGNPLTAMYFIPKAKMPGLSDLIDRVGGVSEKMKATLDSIAKSKVGQWAKSFKELVMKSKILKSILGVGKRVVMAYIFISIWFQVAEISWDVQGLVRGFTGSLSFDELVVSLPESAIGLAVAMMFPGLGTFGLLPISIMARLSYLLIKKIIIWIKGKGFGVDWVKLGMPERGKEVVPAF